MSCSRHPDHDVDRQGFKLLGVAEGMMGTSLQQIRKLVDGSFFVKTDEAFDLAVSARLSCQTEQIVEISEIILYCIQRDAHCNVSTKDFCEIWGRRAWAGPGLQSLISASDLSARQIKKI